MNKQEAIEKIEDKKILNNCLSNYGLGYNEALDEAIYIINQIDELESPAVPHFKEELYTVELPIPNGPLGYHYVLRKTTSGEIIIDSFYNKNWGNYDYCQLTEAEIKKDFDWAWKYAKDVEDD
mgnify:CR=1 FL=1